MNELPLAKRIIGLARPQAKQLAVATVMLGFTSGLSLLYPLVVQEIIDGVMKGEGRVVVDRMALLLLLIFGLSSVLTAGRMYLFALAGHRIVTDLRHRLYGSLIVQEVGFFDANLTGELTNRIAADTGVVQAAATTNIAALMRHSIMSLGALSILFWMSWRLTVVMLALVPVAVFGALYYGRLIRRLSKAARDALAEATAVAEETFSGIRTVRAHAREHAEIERYGARVEHAFGLSKTTSRYSAIFGALSAFAGYGAISGVLWYGGILLVDGQLTMGQLTSFLLYTFSVATSLAGLAQVWRGFMHAGGATERVFELLGRRSTVLSGPHKPDRATGALSLRDVHFAYPTRPELAVLHGIDLDLRPGEMVALVGPSGSGKSTIAALASRFYDPTSGAVLLDDHDLRTLDCQWLRQRVGVVSQEPILFADTLRNNIIYGRPTADDDAIAWAIEAAHAKEFIDALPKGIDTQVGERGVRLSGGQRQRIAIARTLLEDPPLLILDEATSNLDAHSESAVQRALAELMVGRSTLVIAHRLSTVRNADRILVLKEGRVVQEGSHESLLAENGLYRTLVARQLAA